MRIWYDACTGKHVRYGAAIARRLIKAGHKVLLTTRKHPDTLALAKILKEDFVSVGAYDPSSLFSRLKESAKRILLLSEMLKSDPPDVAISHQSVDMCRVAFGIDVPIVLTADTSYANAVNRLTIPLANVLVFSEAIPESVFKVYGQPETVQFRGVDEAAWIKGFKPHGDVDFGKPLIVVRQLETKASYALDRSDITLAIAEKLTVLGNVVFLSRYAKPKKKGLTVVSEFVDSASLVAKADLVVGVGGTMAREAALQGVPSIVISELGNAYVNEYLSEKGFPLFIVDASEVLDVARKHIGKKVDVSEKLAALENPVDVVERIVRERHFSETH